MTSSFENLPGRDPGDALRPSVPNAQRSESERVWSNPDAPHEEYECIEQRIKSADDPELAEWYRQMFDDYGDVFATWLYLDDYLLTPAEITDLMDGDSND